MRDATRVFDSLLAVTTLLSRDLEREFARTGLTLPRVHLLWEVHRAGPTTQRALAEALAVSPRNITGLVDALEASGHARRAPHPTDRRASLVELTEAGRSAMAAMEREHREVATRIVEGMPERDVAALADALDGVVARLTRLVEGDGDD